MSRRRGAPAGGQGERATGPVTPAAIGRTLRQARETRGYDLATLALRISCPLGALEALEAGTAAHLMDPASAVTTLRRFAGFLDLNGDALALQLMELWPRSTGGYLSGAPGVPIQGATSTVTAAPEHHRAFTQTGQIPRIAGAQMIATGVDTGPATGSVEALRPQSLRATRRAARRRRHQLRAPTPLKAMTWIALVLVLVVLAGEGLSTYRPTVLRQLHLLRVTLPDGRPLPPPASQRHTPTTASTSASVVNQTGTTPASATYSVAAGTFDVIVRPSGTCWLQVTTPQSLAPVFSSVIQPGQVQNFTSLTSASVQVGSSAVVIAVVVNGHGVLLVQPTQAPFTYTFTSTSATTG